MPARPAADYDPFAWFYDEYWCREVTKDFVRALERLLLPHLPTGAHVLDLCCGTGRVAAELCERSFRLTGLDISSEMLRLARRNAPRANFILADARSFDLAPAFDAVISTFDSLNHILSLKELSAVFANVRRALRPGGIFFFDVNLEMGFREHWQEHFSVIEEERVCLLHGGYHREKRLGRYDFTLFTRAGDFWQRSDFSVSERCYTKAELKSALRDAGFAPPRFFDAVSHAGLEEHTGRVFILARNEEENI